MMIRPQALRRFHVENKTSAQLTPERLMQMAWGYAPPLIVGAALKHKMFDLLSNGAKTAEQIASEAKISPRGTKAILNALVAFDLLAKDAQQRYSLTPESSTFLVTTKPSYHGAFFEHVDSQLIPKWLRLADVVRSGRAE